MEKSGTTFTKPIVVFMGAPGVGKSTLAKKIGQELDIIDFSVPKFAESLLRRFSIDPMAGKIRKFRAENKPLDDNTIVEIVQYFLQEMPDMKGLILDGFPENLEQAKKFEAVAKITAVYNILNKEDILMEKFAGRRECPTCHEVYNTAKINKDGYDIKPLLPSRNEKACDACGTAIKEQDEDKQASVVERLKAYHTKADPLYEYYKKQGILKDFESKRGVDDKTLLEPEIKKIFG